MNGENRERRLHPEGMHDAEIIDHGITKATSGSVQVAVKYKTEYGHITGWFALTDRSAEYTIEKVRNMGFTGRSLAELNDGQCLVGHRCVITVRHEEYNGQMNAKVSFVNPEGYEGKEIERDAQAAALVSRQFDALLKRSQKSGPSPAQRQGTLDSGISADDPPF